MPTRHRCNKNKRPRRRRRSSKHLAAGPAQITIKTGKVVMLLPRRLKSYNKRGGFWSEFSERKAWKQLLVEAGVFDDLSYKRPTTTRKRLEYVRLAPSKRYLLDKENLETSGKRLTDSLVELGYLVDDKNEWVDGPWLTQGVSNDNCYWTIVTITEAQPYVLTEEKKVDPRDEVSRRLLGCGHADTSHLGRGRSRFIVRRRSGRDSFPTAPECTEYVRDRQTGQHPGRTDWRYGGTVKRFTGRPAGR